jgi:YfiH family protein
MLHYTNSSFSLLFGTQAESFVPRQYYHLNDQQELRSQPEIKPYLQAQDLICLLVLEQTHSTVGYIFTDYQEALNYKPYSLTGDFLVTNLPAIGLAIATGDCLPVICYDAKTHTGGIAHAGWQGSVDNVSGTMLNVMINHFGTNPKDVQVIFGPSARVCCYEVQEDFRERTLPLVKNSNSFFKRDNRWYFDVPQLNRTQLEALGVPAANIIQNYNSCTMHDVSYCSHRRDKANAKRQLTIVSLKNIV